MISTFQPVADLFKEIDNQLEDKISLFTIGGLVLLYKKIKPATKDIDLVVSEKKDFLALEKVLKQLNFQMKKPTKEYTHLNLSQIFTRDDFRIDLFFRTVCGEFNLSFGMMSRAEPLLRLKNISVFLCSSEDVFLFKTMTEREGDLDDCLALSKLGLDWKVILKELEYQINHTGNKIWVTWVGERLDLLQERGLSIPIMEEIDRLRVEYFEDFEKRRSKE